MSVTDIKQPWQMALEPKPWEITLQQLRALMKNEIINHNRIRDRIIELQERYYDNQMGDGAVNWERWAIDHFAYSASYLARISARHPLEISRWESQREKAEERRKIRALKSDKKRAQDTWDRLTPEERTNKKRITISEVTSATALNQVEQALEIYRALPKNVKPYFLDIVNNRRRPRRIRRQTLDD